MKKLLLSLLLSVCLIVPCALVFTGCHDDDYFRKNRTYQFSSIDLKAPNQTELDDILDGMTKEAYLSEYYSNFSEDIVMIFDKKGNVVQRAAGGFEIEYYYEIEDKKVVQLFQNKEDDKPVSEMKISGKKLVQKIYDFNEVGLGLSYVEVVYTLVD